MDEEIKYRIGEKDHNGILEVHLDHPNAIGYSMLNIPDCRIYMISVKPERQGYGSHLLTKVENELKMHGCKEVYLRSRYDVVEFYKRHGYVMDSELSMSPMLVNFKKRL